MRDRAKSIGRAAGALVADGASPVRSGAPMRDRQGAQLTQMVKVIRRLQDIAGVRTAQELARVMSISVQAARNIRGESKDVPETLRDEHLERFLDHVEQRFEALRPGGLVAESAQECPAFYIEPSCQPVTVHGRVHAWLERYTGLIPQALVYGQVHKDLADAWRNYRVSDGDQGDWIQHAASTAAQLFAHPAMTAWTSAPWSFVSLGPGTGEKERKCLQAAVSARRDEQLREFWLVDVSQKHLHDSFHEVRRERGGKGVKLYCADFEAEVPSLLLPERWAHRRLFVIFGNTFGNAADERRFCEQLHDMTQPGDLLWVELAAARDTADEELRMAAAQQRSGSLGQAGAWRDLDERAKLFTGPLYVTGQGDQLELAVEATGHPDSRCAVEGTSIVIWKCRSRARHFEILYSRRYQPARLVEYLRGFGFEPFFPVGDAAPALRVRGRSGQGVFHFVVKRV